VAFWVFSTTARSSSNTSGTLQHLTQLPKGRHSRGQRRQHSAHAFLELKTTPTTAPMLQLPDFAEPFIVECDALGSGFGDVMNQGVGPIAYFSRAIAPHHTSLAAYECELVTLFRQCDIGSHIFGIGHSLCGQTTSASSSSSTSVYQRSLNTTECDIGVHTSEVRHSLCGQTTSASSSSSTSVYQRSLNTTEYKPGRLNIAADALSHRNTEELLV
jgi:hypothetical protein